jgi:CheY-like chemotaxis protein
VADDDPDFRDYVVTLLRREGYEVVEATDGASLVERLDLASLGPSWVSPFDVVVADFHMPGLTGIEVLEGLALAGVAGQVVIVSGFADDATLDWARKLGAAGALSKPFAAEQLLGAVRKASERLATPSPVGHTSK